jgi:hypothetical protein
VNLNLSVWIYLSKSVDWQGLDLGNQIILDSNDFYINNNGNITFNGLLSSYTPISFPISSQPMIAPYWADIDTRGAVSDPLKNNVYYSLIGNQLIVTWYYVGYYSGAVDKLNSFQMILTDRSDVSAGDFDVEFRYEQLQWTTGAASGGVGGLGGVPAQMGFDAGDRVHCYKHPDSMTARILNLVSTGNVYDPGVWRYELRNGDVNPVIIPALTNARVISTISGINIQVDTASFSRTPYSVTAAADSTIIEWRYDAFPVTLTTDLNFDVIMKNPASGESRVISQKMELFYNDVNNNAVRVELGPQSVNVLASVFDSAINTDKPSYQANEDVAVSTTIKNLSGYARTIDAKVLIEDSNGNLVKEVTTLSSLTFNAGEIKIFSNLIFNSGSTYSGGYRTHLILYENQMQIGETFANFQIQQPTIALSTKTEVDRVMYGPNENATITSLVKSLSSNYIFENLTAMVSIASPSGSILATETRTITTLMPEASFTFKSYWNTGTYAPGTYPVTVEVKDSTGTLIATGTQNVVVASVARPSTALKGMISLDKQSLMAGEPVAVTYSVTNVGNSDLAGVALSVQTVHVLNQSVYDNLSSQATLSMGGSFTGSGTFDTTTYSAKDYLVVLRANINGIEETLAGTYFRVEGAPTAPALIAPAMGSDVDTFTPALTVSNASDPNDDKITYEFELYADSVLSQLTASSGVLSAGTGTTAWIASFDLTENATYYWRARAYDGKLYSSWMDAASFRVNTVNELPTAPVPLSPADLTSVSVLTPVLTVTNAIDPDSTNLTYNFQVALDPDFTQIVATTIGVFESQGTTSWQVSPALSENTWYYWRAQADDWQIEGPWSTTATFFVNMANDPPSKPVILLPTDNAVITSLNTDIVLQNSTDIDSPVISYSYEVDTVPSFDSGSTIRSGLIPSGPGTTIWQATGLLDNTLYYVRAMASDDSSAESGWTVPAVSFFVNTANDKPTKPVVANPSIGAEVNVLTPTLTIHNATDLDRDQLTYDFEVYSDAALTSLITSTSGVRSQESGVTSWIVPVTLIENQTYYWRARAFDGALHSDWAEAWFVVNTANDAPGAPLLYSPLDKATLATFLPTLSVTNAVDPDGDTLTYEFEVLSAGVLVAARSGVTSQESGVTSWTVTSTLNDNTTYQWRARASDGDRYGPWMNMATFTVHVQQVGINVELEVEPETLNQKSKGNWVMVEIELPHGYHASDVDIASIRLEGVVPAETRPHDRHNHHHDHGCEHDHAEHDHDELKVKFDRSAVLALLPIGNHVPVHVTGKIGSATFEGVDFIRVMH